MTYLAGLLTLPAIGGVLAALWAIYHGGGRLLEHSIILRMSPKRNDDAALMASAIVATSRLYVVRMLPRYASIVIGLGKVDDQRRNSINAAILRELRSPSPEVREPTP